MKNKQIHSLIGAVLALALACGPAAPVLAEPDDHQDHEHEHEEDAHEDRAVISQAAEEAAGIQTGVAGSVEIRETVTLYGHLRLNEERVYRPAARFPGIVRDVRVRVGDKVSQGQTLAVVESNESLQRYEIAAPAGGLILARHINPGDAAEGPLFELANLTDLWVDLTAFPVRHARVALGQTVRLQTSHGKTVAGAEITYISPAGSQDTQGRLVRAVLPNPGSGFVPGLLVSGEVTVSTRQADVAVRREAIQSFEGHPVVFVRHGDAFEPRQLVIGARDQEHVEVLHGLSSGAEYVIANSYLIKAELLKSSAAHDH